MKELLEQAYEALLVFCSDERWEDSFPGQTLEKIAEELGKPSPYGDDK